MKFSDFAYNRPEVKSLRKSISEKLYEFENANSADEQFEIIKSINIIRNNFSTMLYLAEIRFSIDTSDKFYDQEKDFFDENEPFFKESVANYYRVLVTSKYRDELEQKLGKQLFQLAELNVKTISPEVVEELKIENKLTTEYMKLKASAKIPFRGDVLNMSGILPFMESPDRETRIESSNSFYGFLADHKHEFDEIYDKQVKIRAEIARKLGYDNFVALAYDRMGRTDYDAEMVKTFRNQVKDHLVPLASTLYQKQQKRLNIDKFCHYDERCSFLDGNPKPQGSPDEIIKKAEIMYDKISQDVGDFFRYMNEQELMDLLSRKNKEQSGFCEYIPDYRVPFIFANFNGTAADIAVLTHEAGHAFQVYSSRHHVIPEYSWPTAEAAEIHSMGMEFITFPYWDLFYGDNADKARFIHMVDSLQFIPYGVCVDEFQHFVYENPEISTDERNLAWREIEKKYMPERNYDGNEYLESGCFWHKQGHLYFEPFYYIDYTLAEICAFQFFALNEKDKKGTWDKYLDLCRAGGTLSFTELLKIPGLKMPFEEGCLKSVTDDIGAWIDNINEDEF